MIPGFNSKFECHITGTKEPLTVLNYTYNAGLSQPYQCNVEFISLDPNLSYWSYIDKQANLKINIQGATAIQNINGIITKFTQLGKVGNGYIYTAIIEPHFVQTKHQEKTEVFLNQSIPEILESHLKSAKIQHYRLDLSQDYLPRNFVCQFQETDFNFVCRWMEHEGIYYYFEQGDDFETLVLTDRYTTHKDHDHFSTLKYNQENITHLAQSSLVVNDFSSDIEKVAQILELKGYNYNQDMSPIVTKALVSEHGVGTIDVYDENVLDENDAKRVAQIRAQEISCKQQVYRGKTLATGVIPGYRFTLSNHFRDENNQEYLVFEIAQKGSQRQAALAYIGVNSKDDDEEILYITEFKAIMGTVQFRAPRVTPIKRIEGIIPAKVDAETSGEYAQLDNQGRYKIRLLHSDKPNGQASDWVRKMESYLGDQYGTHFPLHKGAEVCLAFEFGNPDRPIIMGAVHNSTKNNLVTSSNQKQSITKSAGGNMMVMGDQEGKEYMHLHSPMGNVHQVYGCVPSASLGNIDVSPDELNGVTNLTLTNGNSYNKLTGNLKEEVKGNSSTAVSGVWDFECTGDVFSKTFGLKETITMGNNVEVSLSGKESISLGVVSAAIDMSLLGLKTGFSAVNFNWSLGELREEVDHNITTSAAGDVTIKSGVEKDRTWSEWLRAWRGTKRGPGKIILDATDLIEVNSKKEITLTCGDSSIVIKNDGILIVSDSIKIGSKGIIDANDTALIHAKAELAVANDAVIAVQAAYAALAAAGGLPAITALNNARLRQSEAKKKLDDLTPVLAINVSDRSNEFNVKNLTTTAEEKITTAADEITTTAKEKITTTVNETVSIEMDSTSIQLSTAENHIGVNGGGVSASAVFTVG